MKYRSAMRELAEVTESQWGLVTSAQAIARGLNHVDLTRLADSGDLVRLAHGVYKDAGAPSDEHEALRAAWLSIEPKRLAWERTQERPSFATVSGETAAVLHEGGDLRAMRSEFTTLRRRQTQREDVKYRTRALTRDDVTIRAGLPVTTLERTIADLVESRTQLDHVGRVVHDASRKTSLDTERLEGYLAPLAERNGHSKGDGGALLQQLLEAAHIDRESIATQIASHEELGAMIVSKFLASLPRIEVPANLGIAPATMKRVHMQIADQMKFVDWANLAERNVRLSSKSSDQDNE